MSFTTQDKEARKFETDPADSSKVVVKTKVENTDSDAVPVKIINTDANIDVEVSVPSTISIDDSTPVDVAVTGTPNVSVTNTPSVTVSGQVDLDDATAVRVDVTNTAVATNATIQNSSLNTNATIQGTANVNVTNGSLTTTISGTPNVSVSNSELTTRNQLEYTSTEITALGASSDLRLWTSAYADGILVKEFVNDYQAEFEQVAYYTHPSLGDSNKALSKITQYSTQNSQTVIESVDFRIVDWDKDDTIKGSVAISAGTITSPDPNSAISQHTVVTTLTITDNTIGGITLSLSGTNASLYHIHEVETGTHSQTSLAYVAGRTYQIHAHSNFEGSDYSHSMTVTATGDVFGVTASVNIATAGTMSAGGGGSGFQNIKMITGLCATNNALPPYKEDGAKGLFTNGTSSDLASQNKTISFWVYADSNLTGICILFADYVGTGMSLGVDYINGKIDMVSNNSNSGNNYHRSHCYLDNTDGQGSLLDTWVHVVIQTTANPTASTFYVNGVSRTAGNYSNASPNWPSGTIDYAGVLGNMRRGGNNLFSTLESSTAIKFDEVAVFNGHLSSSEITALYNSGATHDLSALDVSGSSSTLIRWLRWGDGTDDVENTIKCQVDSTFVLDKDTSNYSSNTYIVSLSSSDTPYSVSSSFSNSSYASVTAATNGGYVESEAFSRDYTTSFSMSCWIKMSAITTSYLNAFYMGARNGTTRDTYNRYNAVAFQYRGNANNNYLTIGGAYCQFNDFNLDDGNWHNVVITFDGSGLSASDTLTNSTLATRATIYADGSAISFGGGGVDGSNTFNMGTTFTNFRIGDFTSGTAGPSFNVDEFAYWNSTELTSTQAGLVYNSGTVANLVNTTGLTAPTRYWRYEDGSNMTRDSVSNSNQGAVDGTAQTSY